MQRALKRAALPVWETEGFNPHIYLTFALPLSLGIESVYESFDVKMTDEIDTDEICARLNAALTEDLRILKAAEPVYRHTEIKKAEYEIMLGEAEKLSEFLSRDEIIITKKTKKGETKIDIKPLIKIKAAEPGKLTLLLPAGSDINVNPISVITAYGAGLQDAAIKRTAVYCADGEVFI
jgi:radical SAM-linked protein